MNIFQIAKALGADDITSPTIPFIPPNGGLTPTPSILASTPSILLQTNLVSIKKGEKAVIEIVLFTNKQEIKSFKLKIDYDNTAFNVIDSNPNIEGTQINYQNTFFDQIVNEVTPDGEILLEAGTDQGSTSVTSRVVASFEVEALQEGSYQFTLLENDSEMINNLNTDILQSVNSIVINVADERVATTSIVPTSSITIVTPKTGLIDDIGYTNAIILGTLLIVSGMYLFKKNKPDDLY